MSLTDRLEDKPKMIGKTARRAEADSWPSTSPPAQPGLPECSFGTSTHRFCCRVWTCCLPTRDEAFVKVTLLRCATETGWPPPPTLTTSGLSPVGSQAGSEATKPWDGVALASLQWVQGPLSDCRPRLPPSCFPVRCSWRPSVGTRATPHLQRRMSPSGDRFLGSE